MGARQRDWARRERARLLRDLGPWCRVCGSTMFLELDCIKPRGHSHHALEWSQRISFYRRQARLGNLQVLCQRCNAIKGAKEMEEAFGAFMVRMLHPLPEVEISGRPF